MTIKSDPNIFYQKKMKNHKKSPPNSPKQFFPNKKVDFPQHPNKNDKIMTSVTKKLLTKRLNN
jgi:hypothetical protein